MSDLASPVFDDAVAQELSERLADVFRTGHSSDVLVEDIFLDGNPPQWRFQLQGRDTLDTWIKSFVPHGADTTVVRTIPTVTGFVTEFTGRHHDDSQRSPTARSSSPKCATAASPSSPSTAAATGTRFSAPDTPPRPNSSDPDAHSMPTTDPRQQMLGGVPATARTIEVDDVTTAVIEAGDDPPLLLLHGGIECGGAVWSPVLSRLAEQHRIVAPDIPGLGESEPVTRLVPIPSVSYRGAVPGERRSGRRPPRRGLSPLE